MADELDALEFLNSPSSMTGALSEVPTYNPPQQVDTGALATAQARSAADQRVYDLARRQEEQYRAANEIPGTPLDLESGADAWTRFQLSFMREQENQIKLLQRKYGEDNVRLDSGGDLIVRVMDQATGKPKDVKVQEKGLSAKDLIDVAGTVPEIAAGIVATLGARKIPGVGGVKGFRGLQRDILAGALGAEGAGTLKDIAASASQGNVPNMGEILKARGKAAVADELLGQFTLGAGRFFKFMENPLHGSRGPVQFDALGAQKYFRDKYGVDVPMSIGESTGSPLVSRTEAFMERLPGGGTPFKELKGEQEQGLRRLQEIMMGNRMPPTDEALVRQLSAELQVPIQSAEQGVQSATEALQQSGTQGIEDIVSRLTTPQRQIYRSETGQVLRNAVTANRDRAGNVADYLYDRVRQLPGGSGKVFDITNLADDADRILRSLPREGNVPLNEFAPPDVINRLQRLRGLRESGERMSLSELQQMRRDTLEAIPKTEGVPGRGAHYLGEIADAITQSIESNVGRMPGGALRDALENANRFYRENVVPFNRLGITDIFRRAEEGGFVSNSEIVSRLFEGGKAVHNYQLMRETLGAGSPEFTRLRRLVADDIMERSRYPGRDFIDPNSFIKNVTLFRGKNREIADDIFGPEFANMIRQAKALGFGELSAAEKQAIISSGGSEKVSAAEFRDLMSSTHPTVDRLRDLVRAERTRDTLYQNDIMKAVSDGSLPGKAINPEQFINRFIDNSKPQDIRQVMGMLSSNPTVVDDLRSKMVEKVFRDAARTATADDLGKMMSGDPTRIVSAISVFKQIENKNVREKLETVLGPEISEDLKQYINLMKASAEKERQFTAAGGLAAGAQIAELTRRGPLKYMYEAGKDFIVANVLTRQPLRSWLTRVPSANDPGAVSLLLSSPPFLEAVTKEFGQGTGADQFISAIKRSVDQWIENDAPKQQQQRGPSEVLKAEDFLNAR